MISGDEEGPWLGESGKEYIYYVFELDLILPLRVGNYIYARRNEDGRWVPVYMGHGDLSKLCTNAALLHSIRAKGATHVHARLNTMADDRHDELNDLLVRYKNAFPPDGCNSPEDLNK